MTLQRIPSLQGKAITKEEMKFASGGTTMSSGPGTYGISPPNFKYASDCHELNDKGQIVFSEYWEADGTYHKWEADPWVSGDK